MAANVLRLQPVMLALAAALRRLSHSGLGDSSQTEVSVSRRQENTTVNHDNFLFTEDDSGLISGSRQEGNCMFVYIVSKTSKAVIGRPSRAQEEAKAETLKRTRMQRCDCQDSLIHGVVMATKPQVKRWGDSCRL